MSQSDEKQQTIRVIKRYSNRKLYDVEEKRYITLQEIKDLLASGLSVRVIDRDTGEDISRQTLAKILLEMENQQKGSLPLGVLKDIVTKSQESVIDYVRKSVAATREVINQIESNTQKHIRKVVEKGHLTEKEAKTFVHEIMEMADRGRSNLEQMFEAQYKQTLARLTFSSRRDMDLLAGRIQRVERQVDAITTFLTAQGYTPPDLSDIDARQQAVSDRQHPHEEYHDSGTEDGDISIEPSDFDGSLY